MIFVAPPAFQIAGDLEEALKINKVSIQKSESLNEILPHVDSLYMTRVQDEYDMSAESGKLDIDDFNLTPENLKLMKEDAIIMHPLPRRNEIHPEVDLDPRAMYWSCLLYTSPSPRDGLLSRMPTSA